MSWKENLISSTPNIQLQPPPPIKQVQATHTLVAIPSKNIWQLPFCRESWSVFGSQFCQTIVTALLLVVFMVFL